MAWTIFMTSVYALLRVIYPHFAEAILLLVVALILIPAVRLEVRRWWR
jgi:hypothetical protein